MALLSKLLFWLLGQLLENGLLFIPPSGHTVIEVIERLQSFTEHQIQQNPFCMLH